MGYKIYQTLEAGMASKHLLNANNIQGGHCTVGTIAERDALPKLIIENGLVVQDGIVKAGSTVYVEATDKTYKYDGREWIVVPTANELDQIESSVAAQRSYIEAITALQMKVENLENAIKGDRREEIIFAAQSFTDGVWKKDILPDHDRSYFCQEAALSYTGTYSTTDADTIVVNGQSISLGNTHVVGNSETTAIKVVRNGQSLNVYCNDTLVGNVADTIIISLQINAPYITTSSISSVKTIYSYVDYSDVDVKSKNGYAVTENYDGEIVYWTRNPQCGSMYAAGTHEYTLSDQHTKAVYSLGNLSGDGTFGLMMSTWNVIDDTHYSIDPEHIIGYCYMANWDMSKITKYYAIFSQMGVNSSINKAILNVDPLYLFKGIRKLDFTKIKYAENNMVYFDRIINGYKGESLGSFATLSAALGKASYGCKLGLSTNYFVRTYGDLTNLDISKVTKLEELFSFNHCLEFVGDIGKWKVEHHTIKNMFRACFKLRGISSEIGNWNVSDVVAMNGVFDSTLCIGDNTLHTLWKWNVGNCTNFRYMFAYFIIGNFPQDGMPTMELYTRIDPDIYKIAENNIRAKYNVLTDAQLRAIEEENLAIIRRKIVDPKTDLSFVENWNVSSAGRFDGFAANNPYLVNLGDLRKWTIDPENTDLADYGFANFISYCTALTTFKMPSIPRGTNVTDIVRGCTSLANIEIDALNVEAISFEDCPLTKQSVLNLINAATADVTIILSDNTYDTVKADDDVISAIDGKLTNENIRVTIGDLEMLVHTATFHPANGEADVVLSLLYGATITAPTPTKTGYTLSGWSPSVPATMGSSNLEFTAQWTANSHYVQFSYRDSDGQPTTSGQIAVAYGGTITPPTVVDSVDGDSTNPDGYNEYHFTGWSPSVPATMPDEDLSFEAQYTTTHHAHVHVYEHGECIYCGAIDPDYDECEDLGHDFVDGTCARCGAVDPSYDPCATLGHTFEHGVCTTCGAIDPDYDECEDLGHDYQNGSCTRCGQPDPDWNECDAYGHDYQDGYCTRCGESDPNWIVPDPDDPMLEP